MSWGGGTSSPVVPNYLQEPLDIYVLCVNVSEIVTIHVNIFLNLLSVLREIFFIGAFKVFAVINWDLFDLLSCHYAHLNELLLLDKKLIGELMVALIEER